jgi:APA family basic amino acid/polyamine antiporter
LGASVMDGITSLKVIAMFGLAVFGFLIGHGNAGHFRPFFDGSTNHAFMAIAAALVPMAFTYSGWNSAVFVSEEIKNPGKMIPLSLVLGTLATTLIYLAMNAVYLYALPLPELVGEVKVAHTAAARLFGPFASSGITILVATSVLGCLSATLLSNTRTLFALSRDGYFFPFGAYVHPVHKTPNGAIWFEGLWACGLILIGNFEIILKVLSVPLVIISLMTVFSIFIFRRRMPDAPRPYKCWGYPVIPILFVVISCLMLYAKILERGIYGPIGILVFALGVPVYYAWKRRVG